LAKKMYWRSGKKGISLKSKDGGLTADIGPKDRQRQAQSKKEEVRSKEGKEDSY